MKKFYKTLCTLARPIKPTEITLTFKKGTKNELMTGFKCVCCILLDL